MKKGTLLNMIASCSMGAYAGARFRDNFLEVIIIFIIGIAIGGLIAPLNKWGEEE